MARLTRAAAVLVAGLLLIGVIGCSKSEKTTRSAPTHSKPAPTTKSPGNPGGKNTTANHYELPKNLCQEVDFTALKEIFPMEDGPPLLDSPRTCTLDRKSASMPVSIAVNADVFPNAEFGQEFYNSARRLAKSKPTDVPNSGSAAFWVGNKTEVVLFTYDGNLDLRISCLTLDNFQLPTDLPARLARVAAGTFERLAK